MLSIFPCAGGPFVYLLWRKVYLDLLPFYWLSSLFILLMFSFAMQTLLGLLAAAAAAKSLQCPTLCDPIEAAHQAPPSLGFSRQEHWGGLPFPSPMQESETWKWSRSVVSDSSRPHGLQPTRLLHPWDFLGKSTGAGCQITKFRRWRTD